MMSQNNYNSVFPDFLSVTFNPDHFDITEIKLHLCACGYEFDDSQPKVLKFIRPDDPLSGLIRIESKWNHIRISISGKAIGYLIKLKQYSNLLFHLSTFPHKVTRLDASMDVPIDFPTIHPKIARKYPKDRISLGRKETSINYNLTKRDDGLKSGSLYMGKIRDQVQILIYDKTLEMLTKFEIVIPTTTRYEVKLGSSIGMTLKDAQDPTELFWMYGEQLMLKKPPTVSEWVAGGEFIGWEMDNISTLPYQKLSKFVEYSTAINSMLVLADDLGTEGRSILTRLLAERFKQESIGTKPLNMSVAVKVSKEVKQEKPSLEELQQAAWKYQFSKKNK